MLKIRFSYIKILRTPNIRLLCCVPERVNNADKNAILSTTNSRGGRLVEKVKISLQEDLFLYEDFINEVEHDNLMEEVDSSFESVEYEYDSWDAATYGFREIQKSDWLKSNRVVMKRMKDTVLGDKTKSVDRSSYVLDLANDGYISPHFDNIEYCIRKMDRRQYGQKLSHTKSDGLIIAGLNLMSSAVMRLVHSEDENVIIDLHLPVRSLYAMKGAIRYDFSHEILAAEYSYWNNEWIPRERRISIIRKNKLKKNTKVKFPFNIAA